MNLHETAIVFRAEFLRRFRSRVFMIATLLGALMIVFVVEAPVLLDKLMSAQSDKIVLAGPPALRREVLAAFERSNDYTIVAQVDVLPNPVTRAYLKERRAGAAIAVAVRSGALHLDVYTPDLSSFDSTSFRSLQPVNLRISQGLSLAQSRHLLTIDRSLHGIGDKFTDPRVASFARGIAFGLIFVLYLAIVIAAQSVMSSVAEEKTSRIAEILVATLNPTNLLAGKTFAAAALAAVQLAVWVGAAILLLPQAVTQTVGSHDAARAYGDPQAAAAAASAAAALRIEPFELLAFAVFFVLGFLQYATLYAAAASLISRTEDLGSVTTPVVLPVVAAFALAQYVLVSPDSPFAVACSFIPLVSPFTLFTRIAISNVPWWQTALAAAVNLATVLTCFYVAGRVYRVGMLLYGRLPSLKQIWSAIRT